MEKNLEQYLSLRMQSEGAKIEERIKCLADDGDASRPYDVYYLTMKKIESKDKSFQSTKRLPISRRKLEVIKLLCASGIAIVMGFWLLETSIGENSKVVSLVEKVVDDRKITLVGVGDPPRTVAEDSEENAVYQEIRERFNIRIPQFGFLPDGMKYDSKHVFSGGRLAATITYLDKDGYAFYYQISGRQTESSMGIFWDDKLVDEYQLKVKDQVIDIRQLEIVKTKQTTMVAQFYNEDILCSISGIMNPIEFEKIISSLIIFD